MAILLRRYPKKTFLLPLPLPLPCERLRLLDAAALQLCRSGKWGALSAGCTGCVENPQGVCVLETLCSRSRLSPCIVLFCVGLVQKSTILGQEVYANGSPLDSDRATHATLRGTLPWLHLRALPLTHTHHSHSRRRLQLQRHPTQKHLQLSRWFFHPPKRVKPSRFGNSIFSSKLKIFCDELHLKNNKTPTLKPQNKIQHHTTSLWPARN